MKKIEFKCKSERSKFRVDSDEDKLEDLVMLGFNIHGPYDEKGYSEDVRKCTEMVDVEFDSLDGLLELLDNWRSIQVDARRVDGKRILRLVG